MVSAPHGDRRPVVSHPQCQRHTNPPQPTLPALNQWCRAGKLVELLLGMQAALDLAETVKTLCSCITPGAPHIAAIQEPAAPSGSPPHDLQGKLMDLPQLPLTSHVPNSVVPLLCTCSILSVWSRSISDHSGGPDIVHKLWDST
jgi:hypothetical protein